MKKLVVILLTIVSTLSFTACESDLQSLENETAQSSKAETVSMASLPASITNYVQSHYPNATITRARLDKQNRYKIDLSNNLQLYFTNNGTFIKAEAGDDTNDNNSPDDNGGNGNDDNSPDDNGGNGNDDNIGNVNSLPANISSYITSNYPNTTVREVKRNDIGTYRIDLSDGTDLYFNAQGTFLFYELENDNEATISASSLPAKARNYIATNYANTSIKKAKRMQAGSYRVDLKNSLRLFFDQSGNFVWKK
ncbi:MAG: PepSY-like domain-containing protein [Chitinophagales bacterium]